MDNPKELLPLALDDATTIFFEVTNEGGREPVGILDAMPVKEVTETIAKLGRSLSAALETAQPTKSAIEIGMEFAIQNGKLIAIVAQGSAKANLKITLEWSKTK